MRRKKNSLWALRSLFLETAGLALIAVGIGQIYGPAGMVFGGACLVFLAQGMERRE